MLPLPVTLCITELETGGAEKAMTELALGLDRDRFDPVVCSLRGRNWHSDHSLLPRLEEAGIPVEFLDLAGIGGVRKAVATLSARMRSRGTVVMQSFLFHANIIGRLAARRAGVPVICSGVRVAERQAKWHLRLDRWLRSGVSAWVCVSDSVAEFTAQQGIPSDKIRVITNGIAVPNETGTKKELTGWGRTNIVFAGRLTRQKGLDWLLTTTSDWLGPFEDRHLWLLGEGEERAALEQLVSTFSWRDRIHLPGRQTDIPQIFSAADLVILPSRWEGMPNVLLEAMAAGVPIVSTRAEGVLQLLGSDTPEQICTFGETEELVKKITLFLNNPEWSKKIGEQNRRRVKSEFSIAAKIREYESLWQELVSNC